MLSTVLLSTTDPNLKDCRLSANKVISTRFTYPEQI